MRKPRTVNGIQQPSTTIKLDLQAFERIAVGRRILLKYIEFIKIQRKIN